MTRGVVALVALAGCKDKGSPDLVFSDANNYSYTGALSLEQVEIQATSDATVDWSGLTVDIRGRDIPDPTVIEQMVVLNFTSPLDELLLLIEANDILQDDALWTYIFNSEGVSSGTLSQAEITDVAIDLGLLVEDPTSTWLVSMSDAPDGRLDIRMSVAIVPSTTSTNTSIPITNTSTGLDVSVDLQSGATIVTSEGVGPYSFNWTDATVDVYDNPFNKILGNELLIARYDETVEEIQQPATFLTLDSAAEELYRLEVLGTTQAFLEEAVDADGNAFQGFTADGTWLIGVTCGTCTNPAPLLLTVVEVQ